MKKRGTQIQIERGDFRLNADSADCMEFAIDAVISIKLLNYPTLFETLLVRNCEAAVGCGPW